jgi:hypothetical protein
MARKTLDGLNAVEQLNQRFANHVAAAMRSRDARTTRLTLAE